MQPEIFQSSWSFHDDISSVFDQVDSFGFNVNAHVNDCGFNSLFSSTEEASEVSSIPFSSITFSEDQFQYPLGEDVLQLPSLMEDFSMDLDPFDPILSAQIMGIPGYPEESQGSFPSQNLSSEGREDAWSPSPSMKSELSTVQPSPTLPPEDMEMDNQFILPHLLEEYGEARDQGQNALAEVILRCMSQKVSPQGEPVERLAFHLSQDITAQGDFLKQEACKNLEPAFKAFYQGLPHGKVAHFTANSAILEAIPEDSEVIHIIDFDMGDGVQWPPVIEATALQHKTLKLTSIKRVAVEENPECISTPWKSEETRKQLLEHARSCGLKLKIEEKEIEELVTELKKLNKRCGRGSGRREFLAFNCMVGLPHMGRERRRRQVMEFLRVAKNLINGTGNRGIITFGDGDTSEKLKNCLNFRSFFDGNLMHYQALLESTESKFPTRFSEARTAIDFLFVAPYISSLGWLQKWEELREDCHLQEEIYGLEGFRLSKGTLTEVREMLRGSEGSYQARIEGENGNEMVLEWKGTQLVRVSTWGN